MSGNEKVVGQLLQNGEFCRLCIEGSLVSGWTRTPHFFALVRSSTNNHGLLIFSHPGIGSNETTTHAKHAIAVDSNFELISSNSDAQQSKTETQLKISTKGVLYTAEFLNDQAFQEFLNLLTKLVDESKHSSTSFDWLNAYQNTNKGSTVENWPWNQICQPETSSYTPIAFDADTDITSFDPLAPTLNRARPATKNLSNDINKISVETDLINLGQNDAAAEGDLKDFDPLSQEEIEEGIKQEKMIAADLLRRSREVVSNRASASKSWIERTLSQSTNEPKDASSNEKTKTDAFDVVDSLDVKNVDSLPITGNRSASIFKGIRARESYIKLHMAAREKEFTELFPFTIFVGTWNVNGQLPTESLIPWLQSQQDAPDVIAVGFQELDLSAEALLLNDSSREDSWMKAIENGLPKDVEYFKLKHVRLVGMMLVVYVQTKHKMQVTNVESETNGTGIMGMMGNKGGVAVRLQLHNSTICFVNSHLAAHLTEFERRNQDFREIYSKLKFTLFQPPMSISDHNMVFWLGDLNYRFDDLDLEEVKDLINKGLYNELYCHDQLNIQRSAGKVFNGFTEGQLSFQPTYKYDPGTSEWDTSEKSRAPAWCDRVLWRGKQIEQITYKSHPQLKLSDHKPVSAFFAVGIKVVDRSKERKVFEEIVRKLDKRENDSLPQVKLGKHEFHFDTVKFMEEVSDVLPIANIGPSPVEFQFIPKLDETDFSKQWIRVNPSAGFIMPGDLIEIEMAILVDKHSAPLVTVGNSCKLDDILVLHLTDGKDMFIPINGTYMPSVFGSSIEALVRIYGPINHVPMHSLIKLESNALVFDCTDGILPDSAEPLEIPKELWLLIDHLHKHGMTQEQILLQSGIDEEIRQIRNHLDTGEGGKIPGSIYSAGESLLLFLEALPEPVIPCKYHTKCLEACNNYILCKQVITQLPSCHRNVFRYITAFLRELLKQSDENKLDGKVLATVFGSILLRSPLSGTSKNINRRAHSQIAQKKAKFVFHFLVNDYRD